MSQKRTVRGIALLFGVGVGAGAVFMTLSGGGYPSGPSKNDDPRSVLVESVIVSYDAGADLGLPVGAGTGTRARLSGSAFEEFVAAVSAAGASEGVSVRSPGAIIQHEERGSIQIETPGGSFEVTMAPMVLEEGVIRLAIDASWAGEHAGGDGRSVGFSTVFTSAGGGVVLDLSGVSGSDLDGGGLVVAMRPELIDPTED